MRFVEPVSEVEGIFCITVTRTIIFLENQLILECLNTPPPNPKPTKPNQLKKTPKEYILNRP